jgi:hypothetical protein
MIVTDSNDCSYMSFEILWLYQNYKGSSVGIVWLGAGRSGDRIPVEARFSAPVQTDTGVHPASCTRSTGSFPEVKSGQSVTLTPHHF